MIIALQNQFRPAPTPVFRAPVDYRIFREQLEQIDRLLIATGIEQRLISEKVKHRFAGTKPSPARVEKVTSFTRSSFRCGILMSLRGWGFRDAACQLSDSELCQWFCFTRQIDRVNPLSKSSLQRVLNLFSTEEIQEVIHSVNRVAFDEALASDQLELNQALELDAIFVDTTCIKANIHFPTDWVLLRDGVRTLMLAVKLIRSQGLKHRMPTPEHFLKNINKLCIQMTLSRGTKGAKKKRKKTLRLMKLLSKTVLNHANRYRDLLASEWEKTEWSKAQEQVILDRMDNIIAQLPTAIEQAHERIIGGRQVDNADKILSFYEPDVHVLIRKKAGARIEFGNGLLIAEQREGLIVNWTLFRDQPPSDTQLVAGVISQIEETHHRPCAIHTDRGFDSKKNARHLEDLGIYNGLCPKSPEQLSEQMKDPKFAEGQKRRSQSEGRIGILKNRFLNGRLRSKGFDHRERKVAWAILSHNLWLLARLALEAKNAQAKLAA